MRCKAVRHRTGILKERQIGTFIIESNGIGGQFLYGVTYDGETYRFYSNKQSMFNDMVQALGIIWYGFNDVQYNMTYLVDELLSWSFRCSRPNNVIYSSKLVVGFNLRPDKKRNEIDIRDAAFLLRSPLEDARDTFTPEISRMDDPIDFEMGEVFDPDNPSHMEHLKYEAHTLREVMLKFYDLCEQVFETTPRWTPGGTAVPAWRVTIPKGIAYYRQNPRKEAFSRKTDHGALFWTGTTTHKHGRGISIDCNGGYAASMRFRMPCGNGVWTRQRSKDKLGDYSVKVRNPNGVTWPPIVYRDIQGHIHLTAEECTTQMTSEEIEWYEKRGYEIEIKKGLYYPRIENPFERFIDKCEKLEYPNGKKASGASPKIVKAMRAALSGKIRTGDTITKIIMIDDPPANKGYRRYVNRWTDKVIDGLYEKKEKADADHIMPVWGAFITARQRLKTLELIEVIGVENVWYSDTDEIVGDKDAIEKAIADGKISIGPGYGNYKIKWECDEFQVLGYKNYRGRYTKEWVEQHELDQQEFGITASIPPSILHEHPEYQIRVAEGDDVYVEFATAPSIASMITHPDKVPNQLHKRKLSSLDNSVSFAKMDDGRILPRSIQDGHPIDKPLFAITVPKTAKEAIEWLLQDGMSMLEVARQTGISHSSIKAMRNGRRPGVKQLDSLVRLVKARAIEAHKIADASVDLVLGEHAGSDNELSELLSEPALAIVKWDKHTPIESSLAEQGKYKEIDTRSIWFHEVIYKGVATMLVRMQIPTSRVETSNIDRGQNLRL